jgi:hypothetical protein
MSKNVDSQPAPSERAERAARISAMLARWAEEDVSNEPDWDIEGVEPLKLSGYVVSDKTSLAIPVQPCRRW